MRLFSARVLRQWLLAAPPAASIAPLPCLHVLLLVGRGLLLCLPAVPAWRGAACTTRTPAVPLAPSRADAMHRC